MKTNRIGRISGAMGSAARTTLRVGLVLGAVTASPAFAQAPENPGKTLVSLVAALVGAAALGLGIGCLGLVTNHVFPKRSAMGYRVMRSKPALSLVLGVLVTVSGLGLVHLVEKAPWLQLLVLVVYLVALGMFAAGAAARLAGHILDPTPLGDELPNPQSHVKGGLILVFMNGVPILGSIVFFAVLLAGIGATLVAYFVSMGGAAAAIAVQAKGDAEGES